MISFTLKRLVGIDAETTATGIRVVMLFELVDSELIYQFVLEYEPSKISHVLDLKTLFDQQRATLFEDSHAAWDEAVTAFYAHD